METHRVKAADGRRRRRAFGSLLLEREEVRMEGEGAWSTEAQVGVSSRGGHIATDEPAARRVGREQGAGKEPKSKKLESKKPEKKKLDMDGGWCCCS